MNKYLIYTFSSYNIPCIGVIDVEANDIAQAILNCGVATNEIIAVKLRCPIAMSEE